MQLNEPPVTAFSPARTRSPGSGGRVDLAFIDIAYCSSSRCATSSTWRSLHTPARSWCSMTCCHAPTRRHESATDDVLGRRRLQGRTRPRRRYRRNLADRASSTPTRRVCCWSVGLDPTSTVLQDKYDDVGGGVHADDPREGAARILRTGPGPRTPTRLSPRRCSDGWATGALKAGCRISALPRSLRGSALPARCLPQPCVAAATDRSRRPARPAEDAVTNRPPSCAGSSVRSGVPGPWQLGQHPADREGCDSDDNAASPSGQQVSAASRYSAMARAAVPADARAGRGAVVGVGDRHRSMDAVSR